MSLKGFLSYSLLTNVVLAGAVMWQEQVRADALELKQAEAVDESVIFCEHVARELASRDPQRIAEVEHLCVAQLDALRPHTTTIWDPPK